MQEAGVLIFTNSSQGNVAVLLHHGNQLQVVLHRGTETVIIGYVHSTESSSGGDDSVATPTLLHWHTVWLTLTDTALYVELEDGTSLNHTLATPVGIQTVSLGGPHSFFDSPYLMHLSPPRYFIGCMRNLSINGRDILLDSERYGISTGCCTAPRYPASCLSSSLTKLSLHIPSLYVDADTLTLSFNVQLINDGSIVLLADSQSVAWALHVDTGVLHLAVNISGLISRLDCPGDVVIFGEWHQVELFFGSSSISCAINGVSSSVPISPVLTWPRVMHLGGTSVPSNPVAAPIEPRNLFIGCFQRFRLNGADIDPSVFSSSTDAVAATQQVAINWTDLYLDSAQLLMMENMGERLSAQNIILHLPQDPFGDDVMTLYQQEIMNAIHFETVSVPNNGHLFIGRHSTTWITSFEYSNLLSSEPSQQVSYFHSGGENNTAVVLMRVWAGCSDQVLADFLLELQVVIEETPDAAIKISGSQVLFLAVGTRRTITADMLRVEDLETDPTLVLFNMTFVALQDNNCSVCQDGCPNCTCAGAIFRSGVRVTIFTQANLNELTVEFQHWEAFVAAPLKVGLSVTVQGALGGSLDIVLTVLPHSGQIFFIGTGLCLFVAEGGKALLESKHLSAVTDFEEQMPTISYDLLANPDYGVLQVWSEPLLQWMSLTKSNSTPPSPSSRHPSFTQADVQAQRIRYSQSKPLDGKIGEIQFQLRSSNLSGPTGELCINVQPEPLLVQPTISIDLQPLVVAHENASAVITAAVLSTTLSDVYYEDQPEANLDVEDLGIVYTLVDTTSYGLLKVGDVVLASGSNFTYSDITSEKLVYRHSGSEEHQDSFRFYAEASTVEYLLIKAPEVTDNHTLNIEVTATDNYASVLNTNSVEKIQPPEGSWVNVTAANINITDRDRPPSPIKIIVRMLRKANPIGMFALRSNPTEQIHHFFMQDILDNNVIYTHWLNLMAPLIFNQKMKFLESQAQGTYIKWVSTTFV